MSTVPAEMCQVHRPTKGVLLRLSMKPHTLHVVATVVVVLVAMMMLVVVVIVAVAIGSRGSGGGDSIGDDADCGVGG
ncbi:hypothetical protein E2542_SST28035 [Spatholobus suberectus]|nr:hypothetical protein E2542_SST28035 [Spatholobus suberectus]